MQLKIGCCGFPRGRSVYYRTFKLVEVQETFYNLPKSSTVERWRLEAPADFEFSVKAWMAITHPISSPTWRRSRVKIDGSRADRYGFLRPSEENFEAWRKTAEVLKALRSHVCLVQCPPSFGPSPENIGNMRRFLGSLGRDGIRIAWEPRGDWRNHPDIIMDLCERLNLIYVVDIMRHNPIVTDETLYTRLHGLGPREFNYRYKYSDRDLRQLAKKVEELRKEGLSEAYVLFNNMEMFIDAKRFAAIME